MRYADGPTAAESIDLEAAPTRVWQLVSDISLPARFSSELQSVEWLDDASAATVGARFRGRNARGSMHWETTCEITAIEPEQRIEWDVLGADEPLATWRFELEPTGDGGTRLTQWARMGPAPSGLSPMIAAEPEREEELVEMRLGMWRRDMRANLEGIAALLDAG